MDINQLREIVRGNGVVGSGGAGFPTYVKIDERANVILMNCAECEPLLKLHRQLLEVYAYELIKAFDMIADIVGANQAIIGIKKEYKTTVRALEMYVQAFPRVKIHLLEGVYPMGDEVVLIYEATKKVVRPGGLPIEEGIAVFNVETIYNVWQAMECKKPVTNKVISVVGEVEKPVTVRVPLGATIEEVVSLAGKTLVEEPVYFIGGPMMGRIGTLKEPVTKTTNAILVLPSNHYLVKKAKGNPSIDMKRAASICCQCQMCTDLCPRNGLGHPIEPHLFMRSLANKDVTNINPFVNTLFCSSCGICELYACPQSLSPRSLIAEYKGGLRRAQVKPPIAEAKEIQYSREYRKVPEGRLEARLDLKQYNVEAPFTDDVIDIKLVKILLNQHIGVPAKVCVRLGDTVEIGQLIGAPADGLSVGIHASIQGQVVEVTDRYVVISNCNRH